MSRPQIQSLAKNLQKDLKDGNVQNAIEKFNRIRQSPYPSAYQTTILGKKLIDILFERGDFQEAEKICGIKDHTYSEKSNVALLSHLGAKHFTVKNIQETKKILQLLTKYEWLGDEIDGFFDLLIKEGYSDLIVETNGIHLLEKLVNKLLDAAVIKTTKQHHFDERAVYSRDGRRLVLSQDQDQDQGGGQVQDREEGQAKITIIHPEYLLQAEKIVELPILSHTTFKDELLQKIIEIYMDTGNLQKSSSLCYQLRNPFFIFRIAGQYMKSGNYREAQLIARNPSLPDNIRRKLFEKLKHYQALSLIHSGNITQALQIMETFVDDSTPKWEKTADLLSEIVKYYAKAGDYQQLEHLYYEIDHPHKDSIFENAAKQFIKQGNLSQAQVVGVSLNSMSTKASRSNILKKIVQQYTRKGKLDQARKVQEKKSIKYESFRQLVGNIKQGTIEQLIGLLSGAFGHQYDSKNQYDKDNLSAALYTAIEIQDVDKIDLLLSYGAVYTPFKEPLYHSLKDAADMTSPLIEAVKSGNKVVEDRIMKKFGFGGLSDSLSLLFKKGDFSFVDLFERYYDSYYSDDQYNLDSLFESICDSYMGSKGQFEIISGILCRGGRPDKKNFDSLCDHVLMYASKNPKLFSLIDCLVCMDATPKTSLYSKYITRRLKIPTNKTPTQVKKLDLFRKVQDYCKKHFDPVTSPGEAHDVFNALIKDPLISEPMRLWGELLTYFFNKKLLECKDMQISHAEKKLRQLQQQQQQSQKKLKSSITLDQMFKATQRQAKKKSAIFSLKHNQLQREKLYTDLIESMVDIFENVSTELIVFDTANITRLC
jgi:hypothetical protein